MHEAKLYVPDVHPVQQIVFDFTQWLWHFIHVFFIITVIETLRTHSIVMILTTTDYTLPGYNNVTFNSTFIENRIRQCVVTECDCRGP